MKPLNYLHSKYKNQSPVALIKSFKILKMKKIVLSVITLAVTTLVASAMAQDDTCTRYVLDIDLPGASCADIYNKNPTSHGRSGYCVLKTDHLFFAYCDMELDCGGTKGNWIRIADIDTRRGDTCPSGWNSYNSYCTGGSAAGCYSAHFSTNSTSYSKVCGKIVGYQKGTMDGFHASSSSLPPLDVLYIDGISITSGNPRKHVWTYAVGLSDDYNYPHFNCPCAKYPGPDPPIYVGSHYYCESGNTGGYEHTTLYSSDPLWDGAGCLSRNNCCYDAGLPWFFRQFPKTVFGNLEVRICHNQPFADEGVVVEQLQLFVQ